MGVAHFDAVALHAELRLTARCARLAARTLGAGVFTIGRAVRTRRTCTTLAVGRTRATLELGLEARALATVGAVVALTRCEVFARATHRRSQQERGIALQQLGHRRGDVDRRHVVLALIALQQIAIHLDLTAGQGLGDAGHETRHAGVVDRVHARQLHLFDRLTGGALDRAQHALLARGDEQDRVAVAAGTAGTADAVHVAFGVVRNVIVQHVADAFHIQAARGHVGGDQDVELAVLELGNGLLTGGLLHVAIDGGRGQTARLQLLRQLFGGGLGAREDDHAVERLDFQDAGQRVQLVQAAHPPVALADIGRGGGLGRDGDFGRVLEIGLRNAADRRRHGRGEQRHLALFRQLLQYRFDVIDEAHAQHFVGFVQHQRLQLRQVQGAAVQVIDHPARGAHHHVHAALERAELLGIRLAAVHRQHAETGDGFGIFLEGFGHLDGQLARRRQHQRLRLDLVQVGIGQHRQRERGGLAGTGLGLAEHVATGQQRRDGGGLDRRRGLVADGGNRLHHSI